jgi:hypothetical protein
VFFVNNKHHWGFQLAFESKKSLWCFIF